VIFDFYRNLRCFKKSNSRFVYFAGPEGPAPWEDMQMQSSTEEQESPQETPVVENTTKEAQNALLDFYKSVYSRHLSPKHANQYQNRLHHLLSDHFLDMEDVQEINEMVADIKSKVEKWQKIVDRLSQPDDLDYDTQQMLRTQCYNFKTGKINFRGSRLLESKVALTHLFTGNYIKIKINEGRRSAERRGIPKNAMKNGNYYLLKKVGDNYVYETPDNSNIRAVVQRGDVVNEGVSTKNEHNVLNKIAGEYEGTLDASFRSIASYERYIDGNLFMISPVSSGEMSKFDEGVPFSQEEEHKFGSISYKPSAINPAENLLLTDLGKLGQYLVKQFNKHHVMLQRLGIQNDFNNLNVGEAQKFTQYLMRIAFKGRASNNSESRVADKMSITNLLQNDIPVVCRNSAQIFEGCMKAIKQMSTGKLNNMVVTTTSAAYYEGQAGSVGQPNDHAWNTVYMKTAKDTIVTTVVDEFQVAAGKKADRTEERVMLGEMMTAESSQVLIDDYASKIDELSQNISDKGCSLITKSAWKTLYNRYTSFMALEKVDTHYLEQTMDRLESVLKEGGRSVLAEVLNSARSVKYCIEIAKSADPLFTINETWEKELGIVAKGTKDLLSLLELTRTKTGADIVLSEWNMTKKQLVDITKSIWKKLASIEPSLFADNVNYKYLYRKYSLLNYPKPKIVYASRVSVDHKSKV